MITLVFAMLAQTTVSDAAIQAQVAVGPDGAIHVVYIRGGNIEVRTSTDGGKTFRPPAVAIDGKGRLKGGCQRGPRIGADAKGNLVVTCPACFDDKEFENQYPRSELWLVRSTDRGQTWSNLLQVNEVPKKAAEALHWLAVAPDGAAHVAWLDHRDGKANCLWYAKVAGDKVGKNVKLTGAVCECCAPGMAIDGKGNPTIVVREGKKADRSILMTVSRNAGASFSPPAAMNTGRTGLGG